MICEKCGKELPGATIVCRSCNHNNAMQRVKQWREEGGKVITDSTRQNIQADAVKDKNDSTPAIKYSSRDSEGTLIKFPASTMQPGALPARLSSRVAVDTEPELTEMPDWRVQVKEKVRLAKEKRQAQNFNGNSATDDDETLDSNPVVEAALRRIKRPATAIPNSTSPVVASRPAVRSAALARTLEPYADPEELTELTAKRTKIPSKLFSTPATEPRVETNRSQQLKTEAPATQEMGRIPLPKPVQRGGARVTDEAQRDFLTRAKQATEPPVRPETVPLATTAGPVLAHGSRFFDTQIIEIPPIVCDLPEVIIKPASTWLRTLAGACDFEIIAIAYLPIFAAYATLNTSLSNAAFVILSLLLCAFTFIYQFVTLSLAGRTFGMAILNLRIVDKEYETRTVTLRQKALRAWGASIAFICPPLNFLVMRFNRHHYSLPDLLSGTAPVPNQQS